MSVRIACFPDPHQAGNLGIANRSIVNVAHIDLCFLGGLELVDANDDFLALVDPSLLLRGSFFNPCLWHAFIDGLRHTTQRFDLFHQSPGLVDQFRGQALDIIGAGQRIDHFRHAGFMLQNQLCVAGDAA